jgi:hypothetical protein
MISGETLREKESIQRDVKRMCLPEFVQHGYFIFVSSNDYVNVGLNADYLYMLEWRLLQRILSRATMPTGTNSSIT